jgi:hypothetical protein
MRYLICFALLLAGCATTSAVLPIGDGRYSVTADSHTMGPNGMSSVRADVVRSATTFCVQQSKALSVISFDDQTGINTYNSSLIFRCQ